MKNKLQNDCPLLDRLSVLFRKADHRIEEWVLNLVDQIEEEHRNS